MRQHTAQSSTTHSYTHVCTHAASGARKVDGSRESRCAACVSAPQMCVCMCVRVRLYTIVCAGSFLFHFPRTRFGRQRSRFVRARVYLCSRPHIQSAQRRQQQRQHARPSSDNDRTHKHTHIHSTFTAQHRTERQHSRAHLARTQTHHQRANLLVRD